MLEVIWGHDACMVHEGGLRTANLFWLGVLGVIWGSNLLAEWVLGRCGSKVLFQDGRFGVTLARNNAPG